MAFEIADEVAYVALLLGRTIEAEPVGYATSITWRVMQTCPICQIQLAVGFRVDDLPTIERLYAQVFVLFDEHRCRVQDGVVDEMCARAEHESERMAERAVAIKQLELAGPDRGSPSLYERAERESVLLAEWALRFRHG